MTGQGMFFVKKFFVLRWRKEEQESEVEKSKVKSLKLVENPTVEQIKNYLAKGNPAGKVLTVEACAATREIALANINTLNCSNIESVKSTFLDFFKNYKGEKFDLIYIDGHHDGTALLNYMELAEPFSHNETIYLLDDIRWSDSMFNAWNKLKADDRFHVSIDFFRMGMLVTRPYQRKENFIVKLQ